MTASDREELVEAESPVASLTAVVPCFDEAAAVPDTYREIVAALGHLDLEILFVDDGSTDDTLAAIRGLAAGDARVRWISLRRNYGFEAAFSAGYRHAGKPWLVHLDADLQFPPTQVQRLIDAAPGHDAVLGARQRRADPLTRRWGARVHSAVSRRLLGIELPEGATTFRLVRSDVAREVVDLRLGTPYFLATLPRVTGRYVVVPVEHRARRHGRSKFTVRTLAAHGVDLWVGFSRRLAHGAALLALASGAGLLLTALLTLAGFVGVGGLAIAASVCLAALATAVAVGLRYLVLVADGQARPAQYYVAASNVPGLAVQDR